MVKGLGKGLALPRNKREAPRANGSDALWELFSEKWAWNPGLSTILNPSSLYLRHNLEVRWNSAAVHVLRFYGDRTLMCGFTWWGIKTANSLGKKEISNWLCAVEMKPGISVKSVGLLVWLHRACCYTAILLHCYIMWIPPTKSPPFLRVDVLWEQDHT